MFIENHLSTCTSSWLSSGVEDGVEMTGVFTCAGGIAGTISLDLFLGGTLKGKRITEYNSGFHHLKES
jgi:hypothetical protein